MPAHAIIWVYIVRCSDGKYYAGSYRGPDLSIRIGEHNEGKYISAYTYGRQPVELVWAQEFTHKTEAVLFERQIKGWSRKKKEALIRGDYDALPDLSRNRQKT